MKILWLCNLVLPEFDACYGFCRKPFGGWMSGMLKAIDDKFAGEISVSLTFPILDENRMKDGIMNNHMVYSFHNDAKNAYEYSQKRVNRFEEILNSDSPDVVHVWGTEYPWALEMTEACKRCDMLNNTLIHIQGLVSVYVDHFTSGIQLDALGLKNTFGRSILQEKEILEKRGKNEIDVLGRIKHIAGRTEWDRACCYAINPELEYHVSHEVLREDVYMNCGTWRYDSVIPYSIFISQASYPIKGFHYFLKALSIVVRSFPQCRVYVGGNDIIREYEKSAYGTYIYRLIEDYDLSEYIVFCGVLSCEEMIERYRSSNVFVSASTIENSSNSIMEAMMVGTPVISSFVGGVSSIINHFENGLVYPETEPVLLAYYIMELFGDRSLCENLSMKGTETAMCLTDRDNALQELMIIYESIGKQ